MQTSCDIAIIGAGPVGGTLALALAGRGKRVLLVDKTELESQEDPAFDGRAYAVAAASKKLMDWAGIWDQMPYAACPIRHIDVTDGKVGFAPSPLSLHFDHRAVNAEEFGWIIEARSIRVAINRRLAMEPNVKLLAPAEAKVERDADGVTVRVGEDSYRCKLVIAAEGRKSTLREQAGIPVTRLPYNQTAVIFSIAHEKPHNNVALEHFLPGGPFAALPMTGTDEHPNISAIVFTESDSLAKKLYEMPAAKLIPEVEKRLHGRLGAISLVGLRWTYPLYAMFAARYYDTRLALVGDSAHGVHPIAGQGLNLGYQDAMALVELLTDAKDPGETAVLKRYQAKRRPVNLAMLMGMDTLDRLFSTNLPPVRLARDLGLAAVERLPFLKRRFMLTAMGM